MDENTKFYNFIVELTKSWTPETAIILEKDGNEILNVITNEYRENIEIAAKNGKNMAYLCIYFRNARYKHMIPIHDYVEMSEKIGEKFKTLLLEPIIDRAKKILDPFVLNIRTLKECIEFQNYEFHKDAPDVILISVSW